LQNMGKKVEEINYSIEGDAKKTKNILKTVDKYTHKWRNVLNFIVQIKQKNPVIFIVLYIDNI